MLKIVNLFSTSSSYTMDMMHIFIDDASEMKLMFCISCYINLVAQLKMFSWEMHYNYMTSATSKNLQMQANC